MLCRALATSPIRLNSEALNHWGAGTMSWASEELDHADLGDKRRNRRLVKIVEDLAASPESSVPLASRDRAVLQGIYDFWSNPRIKSDRKDRGAVARSRVAGSNRRKPCSMSWDSAELATVDLGNARRNRRPIKIVEDPWLWRVWALQLWQYQPEADRPGCECTVVSSRCRLP